MAADPQTVHSLLMSDVRNPMLKELQRFFATVLQFETGLLGNVGSAIDISSLTNALPVPLQGDQQQDVCELRLHVFDLLEEESKPTLDLYQMEMTNILSCNVCHRPRFQKETAHHLIVSIPDDGSQVHKLGDLINNNAAPHTLETLLPCGWCRKDTRHTQSTIVSNGPETLAVNVKFYTNLMKKTTASISVERDSTMLMVNGSPVDYEMISQARHLGDSITNGHYIADVNRNGQWHSIDDADVTLIQNCPTAAGAFIMLKRKPGPGTTAANHDKLNQIAQGFDPLPLGVATTKRWDCISSNVYFRCMAILCALSAVGNLK
jgi:hypothetical protein